MTEFVLCSGRCVQYRDTSILDKKEMMSRSEHAGACRCRYGSILLKIIYSEMLMMGVRRDY